MTLTMFFHLLNEQNARATPIQRAPEAELGREPSLYQQPGWADIDQDSVPDLFRSSSGVLLVYPSSLGQSQPVELPIEGCVQLFAVREAGVPRSDHGDAPGEGPAGTGPAAVHPVVAVLAARSDPSGAISMWLSEYEVALPGASTLLWSEPAGEVTSNPLWYVGDVDGDGVSDLRLSGPYVPDLCDPTEEACIQYVLRLSEEGGRQLLPESVDGRLLWYVHGVGDLDADGYDDLVLGFRQGEMDFWGKHPIFTGHVAAYRGSASGLQEEPLWRIEGVEVPYVKLAPGASALRLEGSDVLVVSLLNESIDGPVRDAEIGLVRDASTGAAYLDQRVVLRPTNYPESYPDYARSYTNWPKLWLQAEPDGSTSLAVVVDNGVEWFSIDPVDQGLSSEPVSSWVREPPLTSGWMPMAWMSHIDPYVSGPAQPLVAWTQAPEPISTAVGLAVWGWTPPGGGSAILDIDPAYVDPTDCSLSDEPVDPPDPTTGTDPGDSGAPPVDDVPKPPEDDESLLHQLFPCGCAQSSGAGAPPVLILLGVVVARRRRSPGARRPLDATPGRERARV